METRRWGSLLCRDSKRLCWRHSLAHYYVELDQSKAGETSSGTPTTKAPGPYHEHADKLGKGVLHMSGYWQGLQAL